MAVILVRSGFSCITEDPWMFSSAHFLLTQVLIDNFLIFMYFMFYASIYAYNGFAQINHFSWDSGFILSDFTKEHFEGILRSCSYPSSQYNIC